MLKETFPKPLHICVSHIRLLIQMSPSWIIHESIIMHSFCWRRVWGIKNRSEWNMSSTGPSGVTAACPFTRHRKIRGALRLKSVFPDRPYFTADTSATGKRKSGSLTTAELNSSDGEFCQKRFSVRLVWESASKAWGFANCNFQGRRFSPQCMWATVISANRPLLLWYLPLCRGDQILRRCMHTFECQLDCDDREGDVCRQPSVR